MGSRPSCPRIIINIDIAPLKIKKREEIIR